MLFHAICRFFRHLQCFVANFLVLIFFGPFLYLCYFNCFFHLCSPYSPVRMFFCFTSISLNLKSLPWPVSVCLCSSLSILVCPSLSWSFWVYLSPPPSHMGLQSRSLSRSDILLCRFLEKTSRIFSRYRISLTKKIYLLKVQYLICAISTSLLK